MSTEFFFLAMNWVLCYLGGCWRFFFVIWRHFSLLVDSIPDGKLDGMVPWSWTAWSHEAMFWCLGTLRSCWGRQGVLGYGSVTAVGKKHVAFAWLPLQHLSCINLNRSWCGVDRFLMLTLRLLSLAHTSRGFFQSQLSFHLSLRFISVCIQKPTCNGEHEVGCRQTC